jgi:hypothetical protein
MLTRRYCVCSKLIVSLLFPLFAFPLSFPYVHLCSLSASVAIDTQRLLTNIDMLLVLVGDDIQRHINVTLQYLDEWMDDSFIVWS